MAWGIQKSSNKSFKVGSPTLNGLVLISCITTTLLSTSPATAQSSIQFDVPLIVNDALSGNISATITEVTRGGETTTHVSIPKDKFKGLVEKFANEEQLEAWLPEGKQSSKISSGAQATLGVSALKVDTQEDVPQSKNSPDISLYKLRQRGLKINFDPTQLAINSTIPRLGTQTLSLRGRRISLPSDSYAPANFSSGLNLRVENEFNHRPAGGVERGFSGTNIDVNGFTSIGGFGGWALFYEGDYREGNDKEFARGDTTLIHDNYDTGVRYSFGDVTPSALNQQSSPSLLGFNIERNYEEVNPLRNLRPSGRNSFSLDRPARVSFEVNGRIIETRQLSAGDYTAQDFPLTIGANNVRVFVDDGSGNIEIANFSAFSNLDLLAPGLSNFGINLGVLRDTTAGRNRRYTNDVVALGSYERGITQRLTLGAQAEVSQTNALIGSNAVYGTRHGIFGIEVALSKRDGFDDAVSTTLSYSSEFEFNSDWRARADIQFDYQSNDFGGVITAGATNEQSALLTSFGLSKAGYNLSLTASTSNDNDITTNTFTTGISKSFKYFDLSIDYRYSKSDNSDSTDNFSFNISKRLGRSVVRGQYQTSSDQYRLAWNGPTSFEAGRGALDRVVLIDDDDTRQAEFDASYTGRRFILNADHTESQPQVGTAGNSSVTGIRAETSFGFADGKFAFGRPFNDGFLIVSPHKNLRGKKLSVKRSNADGDLITGTKNLSTTLVPLNGSYREQRYHFEVEDLPLGYDIGSGELDVFPSFLSGYNYRIGSDASNTVIGKLLWPDNTPPKLIAGKVIPAKGGEPITVFTNKTGRFVAERMAPGKYTVVFSDGYDDFNGEIVIEERDEPGLIKLDTMVLKKVTQ